MTSTPMIPIRAVAPCSAARAKQLPDGTPVMVRAICPEDAVRLERMFTRLSPSTIYRRFFSPIHQPSPVVLKRLATVDHDRREAFVALVDDEIVGVARYDSVPDSTSAEIAVTIEDSWQHRGLGSLLMRVLTKLALDRGFDVFFASMLADNRPALSALHRLAPGARVTLDSGAYEATIDLRRPAAPTISSRS